MSLGLVLQIFVIEFTIVVAKDVVILHSSSFDGRFAAMRSRSGRLVGGLAKLQPYLQKNKNEKFIMVGDFIRKPYSTRPTRVIIESELMKQLNPAAISLGINEFSLEIDSFSRYTADIVFPVVSTNFRIPHCVVDYKSDPIVVMSYAPRSNLDELLATTAGIFTAEDMVDALRKRIAFYKNNTKEQILFIATGCYGIDTAINIAENVPGINIVLSGCSKTMQWNDGEPPEYIPKDTEYPLIHETKDGRTVLIPHTYGTTRFLGRLNLKLTEANEIESHKGDMIYFSDKFPDDPHIQQIVDKISEFEIAHTRVYLNGDCFKFECNLGNLVADAFIEYKIKKHKGRYYTDTAIALVPAKNINASIQLNTLFGGIIVNEDLQYAINNPLQLVTVVIQGTALRKTVEYYLENSTPQNGLFLQVSGLHIRYDRRNIRRKRLTALLTRCANCLFPTYTDMAMGKIYRVITTVNMIDGTLGHIIFGNMSKIVRKENVKDFDAVRSYMMEMKNIQTSVKERIRIVMKSLAIHLTKPEINLLTVMGITVAVMC